MNHRSNQWSGWDQGSRIPFSNSQSSSLTSSGHGDWQLNNRVPLPSFQPFSDARSRAIRQFEERPMDRFPSDLHQTMQIVLFDSMARGRRPRVDPFLLLHNNNALNYQSKEDLGKHEEQMALKMLKKETYGSDPKTLTRRLSMFYNGVAGSSNATLKGNNTEVNDDSKRCAICLDDFEVGTQVMVTPCNHMFHEDCILPWMKSNGQCPVCRFVIYEPIKANSMAFNSTSVPSIGPLYGDDLFANEDLNSVIRPRYSSSSWDMFLSSF